MARELGSFSSKPNTGATVERTSVVATGPRMSVSQRDGRAHSWRIRSVDANNSQWVWTLFESRLGYLGIQA